jgi:hypothetical protein
MKRTTTLLCMLLACASLLAQSEGQNITLNFLEENKGKNSFDYLYSVERSPLEDAYIIENIAIPLKKATPFVAFSTRLEGDFLTEDNINFFIKTSDKGVWQAVHAFHEGEFDGNKWVSDLTYLDKVTTHVSIKIQAKNAQTLLKKGVFRFFSPDEKELPQAVGQGGGGVLMGCEIPPSVSRTVWGASKGLTANIYAGTPTITNVTHLIVHHSAGANTSTNWTATVAAIFDFHVNTNGWADVGYNYLIAPDGQLFVGRGGGNNVQGAHMCGYNANTMGVCMLGTYTSVAPPQVAIDKLVALLAWKSIDSKIDPSGSGKIVSYAGTMQNISGHRDGCAPNYTECPGDMNHSMLPTIRTRVKETVTACLTSIEDFADVTRFETSPNPSNGQFTLNVDLKSAQAFDIELTDMLGRVVFKQKMTNPAQHFTLPIDVSTLAQGIYYVSLKKDNQLRIKKIAISK